MQLDPGTTDVMELVRQSLLLPVETLFYAHNSFSIFMMCSALLFAAGALLFQNRTQLLNPKKIRRSLFPSGVFLHPSSLFDYRYYFLSRILIIFPFSYLTAPFFADLYRYAHNILFTFFGSPVHTTSFFSSIPGKVLITLLFVLALDFGYWLHHWLMHRYLWLWEFHKAHHSAQRLNVFTSVRAHPLEEIFAGILMSLATTILSGILAYFSSTPAHPFEIGTQNVLLLAFFLTFYHLRHTQIWIPVKGFWGHIVQSPAHHQIHHSTDPRHFNKNFGFCLSVWDWLFGTLYIPEKKERLVYGLGAESTEYNSFFSFLLRPFVMNWRAITSKLKATLVR
jgi:sterol desaturase/sphingolipid hydroxylase (fatty acid hydroxylase superfamily)